MHNLKTTYIYKAHIKGIPSYSDGGSLKPYVGACSDIEEEESKIRAGLSQGTHPFLPQVDHDNLVIECLLKMYDNSEDRINIMHDEFIARYRACNPSTKSKGDREKRTVRMKNFINGDGEVFSAGQKDKLNILFFGKVEANVYIPEKYVDHYLSISEAARENKVDKILLRKSQTDAKRPHLHASGYKIIKFKDVFGDIVEGEDFSHFKNIVEKDLKDE